MIRPIKILKDLIESTAHTVEIDSITDNGGGSYTIETCNTFYLTVSKTFVINAVTYTITSFVLNESITFTGASLPVATSFTINPPLFIYGTPKEVNAEFLKRSKWTRYPFIWLVEISNTEHDARPDARIKTTPNFFMLFLDEVDKTDFVIQDHYDRVIDCQLNEIDYIIRVIKRRKDLFEPEDLTYTTVNHCNFGDYITNRGYDRKILDDNISGAQLQLNLPYIGSDCLCAEEPIISICNPVTINVDGVFSEYVQAGGTYNCETGGGGTASQTFNGGAVTDQDSGTTKAITVKDSAGANIGTKGTDTALALNITVANATNSVNGVPIAGVKAEGDKTILVFNSEATNVGTVVTNSVDELEIEVPDATAVVKNSAGTTIHTELIPSGVSENIVITDSTAVVKNSEGTTLKTEAIPAEVSEDVTLNDITVVDSDGSSGSWPSGKNYTCTPSLNTSSLYKTGQTTSYATNDDGDLERGNGSNFTTLSHNNFFGNTNRFTDDIGGQTYASGWIIDWSTWNQITGDVIWWYNVLQTTGQTWANLMALQPINIGGHADCYVPNENEMQSIVNREQTNGLNYSPLNFSVTTSAGRLWTSTTVPGTTANAFVFSGAVNSDLFISIAKTTTLRYILMRIGNTSEL